MFLPSFHSGSPAAPQDGRMGIGDLSGSSAALRAHQARRPLTPTRKTWEPLPAPAGESAGSGPLPEERAV